jgi:peptide/nickel transport system permease protein
MLRYVGRRFAGLALVLLIVLTLVFFMLRAAPGGPAEAYLGMNPTPEKIAEVERRLGLDQPIFETYQSRFAPNLFTPYQPESLEDAGRYLAGRSRWR